MAKILVVDDQKCIRELLSDVFRHDGYRVATAEDPNSSMRNLQNFKPDLVLLDLYPDGPEGFALLNDLKRAAPRLPVIIFTAYDSYRQDYRLAEADAYVIKSQNLDELKEKIAPALTEKEDGKALRIPSHESGRSLATAAELT